MANDLLVIDEIEKTFQLKDSTVNAIDKVSFSVREGEFVSIVGASGCGKSTMLRLIAGLEQPTSGSITLHGNKITEPSLQVGMVFQESRLFPWASIRSNIEFGISYKADKKQKQQDAQKFINLVGLQGFEKALPKQLSGGMQQRAAIARGLINNPEILLMDEPFGALDAITRINMQNETLRIWQEDKKTVILVTHDIDEAIYLSDRIIVLSSRPGRVKKIISVDLPRPRDRSNQEFIRIRKEIYKEFFEDSSLDVNLEYYL